MLNFVIAFTFTIVFLAINTALVIGIWNSVIIPVTSNIVILNELSYSMGLLLVFTFWLTFFTVKIISTLFRLIEYKSKTPNTYSMSYEDLNELLNKE